MSNVNFKDIINEKNLLFRYTAGKFLFYRYRHTNVLL